MLFAYVPFAVSGAAYKTRAVTLPTCTTQGFGTEVALGWRTSFTSCIDGSVTSVSASAAEVVVAVVVVVAAVVETPMMMEIVLTVAALLELHIRAKAASRIPFVVVETIVDNASTH